MEQPLPAERYRLIEALLRERRAVRVSALAEELGVSEVTVRRDLEELEHRGTLERTHGGAISAQRLRHEAPYSEASAANSGPKRAIGAAAAGLVRPGDSVFLNGGTTTLQVFRHLRASDAHLVTNHVGMAMEADGQGMELLLIGGDYRPQSNSCTGGFAVETLRRVFATRAFIGVEGLSLRSGLTTPAAPEAEVARVMIEQTTGDVVVVADHTKVGTVADFAVASLDRVTALVTDAGIDDDYRGQLADVGIDVVVAEELADATGGHRG
ncbi:MAG: DeoR/GlpR family DNA-binding transcription regulator [Actinomycetota bacterium]|nr:DeoR/GlpR family DNA-binding transcription regulator [Actinomycetota bacterium]MDH5312561.1 DeoR/GlpR family DNA-binding transcription regulator [Actinomycetota bacterium]